MVSQLWKSNVLQGNGNIFPIWQVKSQHSMSCEAVAEERKRKDLSKASCCLAFHVIVGTTAALYYIGGHGHLYPIIENILSQEHSDLSRGSNFTGSFEISPVTQFDYVSGLCLHSRMRNVSSKGLVVVGRSQSYFSLSITLPSQQVLEPEKAGTAVSK